MELNTVLLSVGLSLVWTTMFLVAQTIFTVRQQQKLADTMSTWLEIRFAELSASVLLRSQERVIATLEEWIEAADKWLEKELEDEARGNSGGGCAVDVVTTSGLPETVDYARGVGKFDPNDYDSAALKRAIIAAFNDCWKPDPNNFDAYDDFREWEDYKDSHPDAVKCSDKAKWITGDTGK